MSLSRLRFERFTVFDTLDLELSPGVNVLVGANATGKTHLMKVAYAACDTTKTRLDFAEKLVRVFLPFGESPCSGCETGHPSPPFALRSGDYW